MRFTRYAITMSIRIACFILMVAVQPIGWYTWVFAAGAIVLPYIAVVMANVGEDAQPTVPENPERELEQLPVRPATAATAEPKVIRIDEVRRIEPTDGVQE